MSYPVQQKSPVSLFQKLFGHSARQSAGASQSELRQPLLGDQARQADSRVAAGESSGVVAVALRSGGQGLQVSLGARQARASGSPAAPPAAAVDSKSSGFVAAEAFLSEGEMDDVRRHCRLIKRSDDKGAESVDWLNEKIIQRWEVRVAQVIVTELGEAGLLQLKQRIDIQSKSASSSLSLLCHLGISGQGRAAVIEAFKLEGRLQQVVAYAVSREAEAGAALALLGNLAGEMNAVVMAALGSEGLKEVAACVVGERTEAREALWLLSNLASGAPANNAAVMLALGSEGLKQVVACGLAGGSEKADSALRLLSNLASGATANSAAVMLALGNEGLKEVAACAVGRGAEADAALSLLRTLSGGTTQDEVALMTALGSEGLKQLVACGLAGGSAKADSALRLLSNLMAYMPQHKAAVMSVLGREGLKQLVACGLAGGSAKADSALRLLSNLMAYMPQHKAAVMSALGSEGLKLVADCVMGKEAAANAALRVLSSFAAGTKQQQVAVMTALGSERLKQVVACGLFGGSEKAERALRLLSNLIAHMPQHKAAVMTALGDEGLQRVAARALGKGEEAESAFDLLQYLSSSQPSLLGEFAALQKDQWNALGALAAGSQPGAGDAVILLNNLCVKEFSLVDRVSEALGHQHLPGIAAQAAEVGPSGRGARYLLLRLCQASGQAPRVVKAFSPEALRALARCENAERYSEEEIDQGLGQLLDLCAAHSEKYKSFIKAIRAEAANSAKPLQLASLQHEGKNG